MITQKDVREVLKGYGKDVTIATLGGHSALDVCRGAKDEGLATVAVCRKDRAKTYAEYYRSRNGKGIVDEVIQVNSFSDLVSEKVQEKLRKLNAVFINSRYFWVHCNLDEIENKFLVPVYGTRQLVRKEERDEDRNQYFLLEEAGIKDPEKVRQCQRDRQARHSKGSRGCQEIRARFLFCIRL